MKDNSDNPFWGKQKPLRKYITGGSLSFSVKDKKILCTVTKTTKQKLYTFEVLNKIQLDSLLSTKSIIELKNHY